MKRALPFFVVIAVVFASSSCLDWSAFGPNGSGPGREGEGDAAEGEGDGGEGEGAEGEGDGGEGEGDNPSGPRWIAIDAAITAQAELASAQAAQLSSSGGRLFAVGDTHVFELVDDTLEPIAELAVPCASVQLSGPVAVDNTDLLVGTRDGAVRFHADGSCDAPYAVGTVSVNAVTAFAGGALIFTGSQLHLIGTDGAVIDDHAFDFSSPGAFYADGGSTSSVILVRGGPEQPGQAVRITKPGSELVVEVVSDAADMMAGATPVTMQISSDLGAPFLQMSGDGDVTHKQVRVANEDSITAAATDFDGEVAAVGPSALVATVDIDDAASELASITGERYGPLGRIVASAGGEVWAVGHDVILYWSPASALAFKNPDVIHSDVQVNDQGPLVAVTGSLFFADDSYQLHRADVAAGGAGLDVVQIIDNVSFAPVTVQDFTSRFAFLAAGGGDPARLVEASRFNVVVYELSDDLGAVTATLPMTSSFPVSSVTAVAVLDDASKIALVSFGSLYVCSVDLPSGGAPVVTCGSARNTGVSSPGAITIIDPSPGIDDETYVVSGAGAVAVVEPGESGRPFTASADANVRALLINDCILAFSSSQGWSAVDQDQPLSPAARRGFAVTDVAAVGDRVLIVGNGGGAGQLASIPLPATSTCDDAQGAPVLAGAAMLGGEKRSQTSLQAAAFVAGELYVLDVDGLLWHVPTP